MSKSEDLKSLESLGIADVLMLLEQFTRDRQDTLAITPGGYFIRWHHTLASQDGSEAGKDWIEEYDQYLRWDLSKDKMLLQSDEVREFISKEFLGANP